MTKPRTTKPKVKLKSKKALQEEIAAQDPRDRLYLRVREPERVSDAEADLHQEQAQADYIDVVPTGAGSYRVLLGMPDGSVQRWSFDEKEGYTGVTTVPGDVSISGDPDLQNITQGTLQDALQSGEPRRVRSKPDAERAEAKAADPADHARLNRQTEERKKKSPGLLSAKYRQIANSLGRRRSTKTRPKESQSRRQQKLKSSPNAGPPSIKIINRRR